MRGVDRKMAVQSIGEEMQVDYTLREARGTKIKIWSLAANVHSMDIWFV